MRKGKWTHTDSQDDDDAHRFYKVDKANKRTVRRQRTVLLLGNANDHQSGQIKYTH